MADYATLQEVKDHLPNDVFTNTRFDTILAALITRASREMDRLTNRKPNAFVVSADSTRYFDGPAISRNVSPILPSESDRTPMLFLGELAAAPTSLAVKEDGTNWTTWASTDYFLWPYNALDEGEPYRALMIDLDNGTKTSWFGYRQGVRVIGKFGFSTAVPDPIKECVIIQVGRWFKRGQMGFQDKVQVVDNTAAFASMFKADQDMISLLTNYRRVNL